MDQYDGNQLAATKARYARTLTATSRHIIKPGDQWRTLCGSRVRLPELYVGDDGSFKVAGRSYTYDLPACQRCDKSAAKRGITPDLRIRSVESAELQAYAEARRRAHEGVRPPAASLGS